MNKHDLVEDHDILRLFNLDGKKIENFFVSHKENGVYVSIKLALTEHCCPVCQTPTTLVKGYTTKQITHSALSSTPCFITYRARRMLCPACNKTFYEHNPFTFTGMKISLLTVYNVLNDLKNTTETFSSVASRNNISTTTAAAIFDKHVQIPRRTLPEVLSIDECYAFHSDRSDYVCVLYDCISQNIVDLLPSRHKANLIDYFHKIPRSERESVKLVAIDLWKTYREVTKLMLPNARLACDKFHIFQEFSRRLSRVRIDVMNRFYVSDKEKKSAKTDAEKYVITQKNMMYYVFKKFNWLLFTKDDKVLDVNRKKEWNSVVKRYLNYYDLLNIILTADPDMNEAYNLYYQLQLFYKHKNEHEAKKQINDLIALFQASNIEVMHTFSKTLIEWKQEIINSFIVIEKTKKKVNNAMIENTNKAIKTIKRNSNGFSNWDRFRNRVLYAINDDVTYSMYPLKEKTGQAD